MFDVSNYRFHCNYLYRFYSTVLLYIVKMVLCSHIIDFSEFTLLTSLGEAEQIWGWGKSTSLFINSLTVDTSFFIMT